MKRNLMIFTAIAILLVLPGLANREGARSVRTQPSQVIQDSVRHRLFFPLFVDGFIEPNSEEPVAGALGDTSDISVFRSRLILTNPYRGRVIRGKIVVWAEDGQPADIALSDQAGVDGLDFEIPAGGTAIFSSHGERPLHIGAAAVFADGKLLGGLVIDGPNSSVGLEPSVALRGFLASLEFGPDLLNPRNVLAMMNLEDRRVAVRLVLQGPRGGKLATAVMVLPPRGHIVRLVEQLPWVATSDTVPDMVGASIRGRAVRGARVAVVNLAVTPAEMWSLPVGRSR